MTPYGYTITDGQAKVNREEALRLKEFFRLYLEDASMAEAARTAGLPLSRGTWTHLFEREEYAGTDFYPAIITQQERERLVEKRSRELEENRSRGIGSGSRLHKAIPIYTEFRINAITSVDLDDPADMVENFYKRIKPRMA